MDVPYIYIELLRRIPSGRKVTARDLQTDLENCGIHRDLRSVQRYLERLSEHYPIERDERSKPYGYRWAPGSEGITLPLLSSQQALLLSMAEQQLRQVIPANLHAALRPLFSQAQRQLEEPAYAHRAKKERSWIKKTIVMPTSQPLMPPAIKNDVFECVSDALYHDLWLDLEYRSATGKQISSRVMPLGLVQQGVKLYLVCRFEGFKDNRMLVLHRIARANLTEDSFDRPSDFDLSNFHADGYSGFGQGRRVLLSLIMTKGGGQHLLETPLSNDQIVVDMGDTMKIEAQIADTPMLDWWLRALGDAVIEFHKKPIKI